MTPRTASGQAERLMAAMLCAGTVTGQLVAGKALRDTLFLTSLDVTSLPAMLMATSVVSLALVGVYGRFARRFSPATLVPASFVVSALLFLVEWTLRPATPTAAAIILYLHISAAGPLLASGFWLIVSEEFDPHTAKRRFGQLAGAGTVGGLIGALVAERAAAWFGGPSMLPVLALLQVVCAVLVRRLVSGPATQQELVARTSLESGTTRSGVRVIAETPYLRQLAILVLLGTTGAALVDYLFKASAVDTFGRGDQLLRFFALYYAGTSIVTLVLQASSAHVVLERCGLGATASTPSVALLLGSLVGLVAPGFGSLVAARGGESILRSSWFRAGYELFYTPIPAEEKRAAKSLIDVVFDRLGDASGGALVRASILLVPALHRPTLLVLAAACSLGGIMAAIRLNRGYVGTLQNSLANRAGLHPSMSPKKDRSTHQLMLTRLRHEARISGAAAAGAPGQQPGLDAMMLDIQHLRSRDRARIVSVLARVEGLPAALVPHVIPLLAWEPASEHATFALQKVAEEHIGQFVDVLLDPNQDFSVRRRLVRVFSVCVSQRAVDGLMVALDDLRFAVRYQASRSLYAILDRNPLLEVDRERVHEIVLKEVAVGRPVWEGRRLLEGHASDSPLDTFVRDRAGASLAHVFTLLSLVLPRDPLQLAFRGLQTDDEHLRGTALEYLDSVLPNAIKPRLWPFLEHQPPQRSGRAHDETIAALLRSNRSIELNLEELRKRTYTEPATSV